MPEHGRRPLHALWERVEACLPGWRRCAGGSGYVAAPPVAGLPEAGERVSGMCLAGGASVESIVGICNHPLSAADAAGVRPEGARFGARSHGVRSRQTKRLRRCRHGRAPSCNGVTYKTKRNIHGIIKSLIEWEFVSEVSELEADKQRAAIELFWAGLEPSRIALILDVPAESVHDLIVKCWAADSEEPSDAKAA